LWRVFFFENSFYFLSNITMQTKRARYEQHVHKHGKNAVSDSAFRKRISSGRTIQQAIETPKLYANEYAIEKEKKKSEPIAPREEQSIDAIIIFLNHFEEIRDEIKRIRMYIKRT
jgi:hypothetical protein